MKRLTTAVAACRKCPKASPHGQGSVFVASCESGTNDKARGRGRDHNRYQNAGFAERGLIFLLTITHATAASPTK